MHDIKIDDVSMCVTKGFSKPGGVLFFGLGEVVDLSYYLVVGALHLAIDAESENQAANSADYTSDKASADESLLKLACGFGESVVGFNPCPQ